MVESLCLTNFILKTSNLTSSSRWFHGGMISFSASTASGRSSSSNSSSCESSLLDSDSSMLSASDSWSSAIRLMNPWTPDSAGSESLEVSATVGPGAGARYPDLVWSGRKASEDISSKVCWRWTRGPAIESREYTNVVRSPGSLWYPRVRLSSSGTWFLANQLRQVALQECVPTFLRSSGLSPKPTSKPRSHMPACTADSGDLCHPALVGAGNRGNPSSMGMPIAPRNAKPPDAQSFPVTPLRQATMGRFIVLRSVVYAVLVRPTVPSINP